MKLPPQLNRRFFTSLLAGITCLAALGSCGGGGGSSSNSNPPLLTEVASTGGSIASGLTTPTIVLTNTVTNTIGSTTTSTSTSNSLVSSTSSLLLSSSATDIACLPSVATPSLTTSIPQPSPFANLLKGPGTALLAGRIGDLGNVGSESSTTFAAFSMVSQMIVDSSGNIYLTDSGNHVVRKISTDGSVSVYAGRFGISGAIDGEASLANFFYPSGLAFDQEGGLYVADAGNKSIRKISPDRKVSTVYVGVKYPRRVATDGQGNLYVAYETEIIKINSKGIASNLAGSPSSWELEMRIADGVGKEAVFANIEAMAVDSVGNVYVGDGAVPKGIQRIPSDPKTVNSYSVRKITPDGKVTTIAGYLIGGDVALINAVDIAIDTNGNLVVADLGGILLITTEGNVNRINGAKVTNTSYAKNLDKLAFQQVHSIAVNNSGNFYVSGMPSQSTSYNSEIFQLDKNGELISYRGDAEYFTRNGIGSKAGFLSPGKITVDTRGNLYLLDAGSIRKISTNAIVDTLSDEGVFSSAPASKSYMYPKSIAIDANNVLYAVDAHSVNKYSSNGAMQGFDLWNSGYVSVENNFIDIFRLTFGSGMVIDNQGSLYVADSGSHSIRKISPNLSVTSCAGQLRTSGSADGIGANARFSSPFGIALDKLGNIYVADTGNHTIRKISAKGIVSTVAGLAGTSGFSDGIGSEARFNLPRDLVIDNNNNLYVIDAVNYVIRKITPAGIVSTVAGFPGVYFDSQLDKFGALAGRLGDMRGMVILPTAIGTGVSITLAVTMDRGVMLVSLP